ncbi:MAG: hypothetical protein IV100_28725, partial [Myxococcales bacterium]|nr:hypothetical protein [Myxococcales bacterium]
TDVSCNDSNVCTTDACSGAGGCANTNNTVVFNAACYTGTAGTLNVGLCKAGTEYCANGGPSGTCVGQVTPVAETCDLKDNDCDGVVDDGVLLTFYRDLDGDGWGDSSSTVTGCTPPAGYVAAAGDCVDSGTVKAATGYWGVTVQANQINPAASEKCNDVDDNCNTQIDEDFPTKGSACDGADADSCTDGLTVCNAAGTATQCVNQLVWGTYGFNSDQATEIDLSGYGNHATDAAGQVTTTLPTTTVPVGGTLGTSRPWPSVGSYNGASNTIYAAHAAAAPYNLASPQVTMTAWIRPTGTVGSGIIVNKESSYEMAMNGANFECAIQLASGGWAWQGSTPVSLNVWSHVVCTYSASTCKIETWVNGVKRASVDNASGCVNLATSASPLHVGQRPGSSFFLGQIGAVGVYDVKLTDAQIVQLANAANQPFLSGSANHEYCDGIDNDCDGSTDELNADVGAACTEGVGACSQSSTRTCDVNQLAHDNNVTWGRVTQCTVTGKANGTACDDGVSCTHTDRCNGGASSTCGGTTYVCSGTCRACDGAGTCTLAAGNCFIAGTPCSPTSPSCAGTCYAANADPTNAINSTNNGANSCRSCQPVTSNNSWTNRPSGYQCLDPACGSLVYTKADTCNGTGSCIDQGTQNCNDANLCTDDSCATITGCGNLNNSYVESCYTGLAGTVNVGDCRPGTRSCSGGAFGACVGDIKPATELCDVAPANDEDCDGSFNEAGATGCTNYYTDVDGDGYGVGATQCLCAAQTASPFYRATQAGDCNDGNANAAPNKPELCSTTTVDDNCNGTINEQGASGCITYYKDFDGDGFGVATDSRCLCAADTVNKYTATTSGDCLDTNAAVKPGAVELCNNIDDNCVSGVDEGYNKGAACTRGSGGCANTGAIQCHATNGTAVCSVTGKVAGTACADGNPCTGSDVCNGGDASTCAGSLYSCNDSLTCTTDTCSPNDNDMNVCIFTVNPSFCAIGGVCYADGASQGASSDAACKFCNSSNSTTAWTNRTNATVCNASTCAGTTFNATDYCGNLTGTCADSGTQNCNGANVCLNYACSAATGCSTSNKGDGTKCGGEFCSGDTWTLKDFCEAGVCKTGGTQNCNGFDNACRNGYCSATGCQIQNFNAGVVCAANSCVGDTRHIQDTCNGTGTCVDGGTQNCNALDTACTDGYCSGGNCLISNRSSLTPCANGNSNLCASNVWYPQDYCNGTGSCADSGSTNCSALNPAHGCSTYTCGSLGCGVSYAGPGTACVGIGKTCNGNCYARPPPTCNGGGSCVYIDNYCPGKRCASGDCTAGCSNNTDCCDDATDFTCILGTCTGRVTCGGICDDGGDCSPAGTCVNCGSSRCQNHGSGNRCYYNFQNSSACGCATTDAYGNCTGYHSCWRC